jgi:dienelactone hydrolase
MACCPTDIIPDDDKKTYAPKGKFVSEPQVAYVTGNGPRPLLFIPDIFGYHSYTIETADRLAAAGFTVYFPDFFDGKPWDVNNMPPADGGFEGPSFQAFIQPLLYTEAMQAKLKVAIAETQKAAGGSATTVVGCVGFCWGSKLALSMNGDGLVGATVLPHPSFIGAADGAKAKAPVLLMPSKDDSAMEDTKAALEAAGKLGGYRHFDDVHHGWMVARAKPSDALITTRQDEGLAMAIEFLTKTVATVA